MILQHEDYKIKWFYCGEFCGKEFERIKKIELQNFDFDKEKRARKPIKSHNKNSLIERN